MEHLSKYNRRRPQNDGKNCQPCVGKAFMVNCNRSAFEPVQWQLGDTWCCVILLRPYESLVRTNEVQMLDERSLGGSLD